MIQTVPLAQLHAGMVNSATTLSVPPPRAPGAAPHMRAMFEALGGKAGY